MGLRVSSRRVRSVMSARQRLDEECSLGQDAAVQVKTRLLRQSRAESSEREEIQSSSGIHSTPGLGLGDSHRSVASGEITALRTLPPETGSAWPTMIISIFAPCASPGAMPGVTGRHTTKRPATHRDFMRMRYTMPIPRARRHTSTCERSTRASWCPYDSPNCHWIEGRSLLQRRRTCLKKAPPRQWRRRALTQRSGENDGHGKRNSRVQHPGTNSEEVEIALHGGLRINAGAHPSGQAPMGNVKAFDQAVSTSSRLGASALAFAAAIANSLGNDTRAPLTLSHHKWINRVFNETPVVPCFGPFW